VIFGFVRDELCHRIVSILRGTIFWELLREAEGVFKKFENISLANLNGRGYQYVT
jgi:hypothetical protein